MSVERYFVDDDVLLRGAFKVDGVEQTPSSATIEIIKSDNTILVAETAATIATNDVTYQTTDLAEGAYIAYFTAVFATGDQRTGTIPFRVVRKDGSQQ